MLATAERRLCDLVMRRRRHDNPRRIHGVEQLVQPAIGPDAQLLLDSGRALRSCFVKTDELRGRHIPKDAHVMISECTGADDANSRPGLLWHWRQITSPRSLRSRKLRNSSTSG